MSQKHQHSLKYRLKEVKERIDTKAIVIVWVIEIALFLFVAYKGMGINYLPVTLLLMLFTALGCCTAFYFLVDRHLLIYTLILLNLGFVVQEIEDRGRVGVLNFLLKFIITFVLVFVGAFLYKFLANLLSCEGITKSCMVLQILVCMVMSCLGTVVGNPEEQGAIISLGGITLFEVVKVMYLFSAVALLCKPEKDCFVLFSFEASREVVLVVHTTLLSFFFLFCKELGTLLVIWTTVLILLFVFGNRRKMALNLSVVGATCFMVLWYLCDRIIYPLLVVNKLSLPSVVSKVIARFGTALHPEKFMLEAGYQGTMGLQAIAVGGILGISTERHRIYIPEASSDYAFANVVQTCGLVMGIVIILFFLFLLKRGMEIAFGCRDMYFQGLAMGITVLFAVETIIHIGYNIAFLPITGIPLYFISQGFTAIVTGMTLIAILLVISSGTVKRKESWNGRTEET